LPVGGLVGLLPATHERGNRSPLAQRDDGLSVQSQPVHFYFSGFTANLSLTSAEITQLSGRDFSSANLGTHDGQGRNKVRFDKFPQGGNESAPGEVFLWGHQADRRPAVKTLTNEASIEGRFRFAGKKPGLW
jgi:hypothetical protein